MSTRIIRVMSSQGVNNNKLTVNEGIQWAELKTILKSNGYNIDSMKAVESTKRTTLEHEQAVVPDGNFSLFLYPLETKSGAASRSDLYASVKAFVARDGDQAKNFFNEGKNFTQKSSDDLDVLVTDYEAQYGAIKGSKGGASKSKTPAKAAPAKTAPAKKVKAAAKTKAPKEDVGDTAVVGAAVDLLATTDEDVINNAINLLSPIKDYRHQDIVEQAIDLLKASLAEPEEDISDLEAEYNSIRSGLKGVKKY